MDRHEYSLEQANIARDIERRFHIPLLDAQVEEAELSSQDFAPKMVLAAIRAQLTKLMKYVPEEGWDSNVDLKQQKAIAKKYGVQWDSSKEDRLSVFLLDGFSGVHPQQDPQSVRREKMWMDWNQRLNYLMQYDCDVSKVDWRYELSYRKVGPPNVTMHASNDMFWDKFNQIPDRHACEELILAGVPRSVIDEEIEKRRGPTIVLTYAGDPSNLLQPE